MADPRARVILESVRSGDAAFQSFQRDLEGIAVKAQLVADVIREVVRAGVEHVKATFEEIDSLAKQADALGVSTEALSALRLAANLSGLESEQLNKALVKQTRLIYEASQGQKVAVATLEALGLTYADLTKLSPDRQFETLAEALRNVENTTQRVTLATEIFGAKNAAILDLVLKGKAGIEEAREATERFGTALTRLDAAKVEGALDAIKLVQEKIKGLASIVAVEISEDITAISKMFTDTGNDADGMRVAVRNALNGIETGVGLVLDAYYGWQLLILKIKELSFSAAAETVRAFEEMATKAATLVDGLKSLLGSGPAKDDRTVVTGIRDDLRASVTATQEEVNALIAAGPPSAKLAENIGRARAEAEAAARHVAATAGQRNATGGAPIDTSAADAAAAARAQKLRDEAERGVRQVEQVIGDSMQREIDMRQAHGTLTIELNKELSAQLAANRAQVEDLALADQMDKLRTGLQQRVITEDQFNALREQAQRASLRRQAVAEQQAVDRFKAIQAQKVNAVRSLTGAIADALTAGGENSKKDFEQHKKIAIAAAIIDTIGAALNALRTVPYPANFIAAAAVAAAGYAQVARIRSTTWSGDAGGGGGSIGSGGGAEAGAAAPASLAPPAPSAARSGTTINLVVQGSVIGEGGRTQLAEDLAKLLREHVDRTDDTLVTVTSRNGLDLAGVPA